MHEWELSQNAQHWFNVVLLWVGFGTSAGLLARCFMPVSELAGAMTVVVLGVLGSLVGPLAISYLLGPKAPQPISPLGLLAAAGCTFVLMIFYRTGLWLLRRRPDDESAE